MRHKHKALITANVLLLAALAAVTLTPGAGAQSAQDRTRGSYTITTGDLRGSSADSIFIVDSSNQQIVALRYNDSNKELVGIDFADFRQSAGRPGGAR